MHRAAILTLALGAAIVLVVSGVGDFYASFDGVALYRAFEWVYRVNIESAYVVALLCIATALLLAIDVRRCRVPPAARDRLALGWWALTLLIAALAYIKIRPVYDDFRAALDRLDWREGRNVSSNIELMVAGGVALAAGIGFLPFLSALPPRVRYGFLAGGAIFLLGAVGVDHLGQSLWQKEGSFALPYLVSEWIERAMEMGGLIVFVDALCVALRTDSKSGA